MRSEAEIQKQRKNAKRTALILLAVVVVISGSYAVYFKTWYKNKIKIQQKRKAGSSNSITPDYEYRAKQLKERAEAKNKVKTIPNSERK